jgi:hypothetical protein
MPTSELTKYDCFGNLEDGFFSRKTEMETELVGGEYFEQCPAQ